MRRFSFVLLMAGLAIPSWAANNQVQPVTVAQLGQYVAGAKGQSDGKVAKDLQGMMLTERLSAAQLVVWQADLPGPRSRDVLTVMADTSMLLPPPQADMVNDAPPDAVTQNAIFAHAADYVAQTLAKLPALTATRTTQHFEDDPASEGGEHIFQGGSVGSAMAGVGTMAGGRTEVLRSEVAAKPLHLTGQSTAQVSYRDGLETLGADRIDASAINQPEPNLVTAGEFGPILALALKDAQQGDVTWDYWQQTPLGKLAVFTYKVADGGSSYQVALKHGMRQEKLFPAYHGEIVIDPATGAVLRLTVVANSLRSQTIMGSALAIDYGSVTLAGKTYICPIRGIAILRVAAGNGVQTQVNDASFTNYQAQ